MGRTHSLCMIVVMLQSLTYGQSVISPSALGMASYGALVRDTRGFTINPAGLVFIRDWDFHASTYRVFGGSSSGLTFHGFALGKRFLERHAVAIQYSPGSVLEFSYPARIIGDNEGSDETIVTYDQPAAIGYAFQLSDAVSFGVVGSMTREIVKERFIRTGSEKLFDEEEHEAQYWGTDLSVLWRPDERTRLSVSGRNLFRVKTASLPTSFDSLKLPHKRVVELFAGFRVIPQLTASVSVSSLVAFGLGFEWNTTNNISFRAGTRYDKDQASSVYEVSGGLGWMYDVFEIDASYTRYVNQSLRSGGIVASDFDPSRIQNISANAYTPDRLSLSVKVIFGNIRESLVRIESAKIFGGVYPSSYETFAFQPIGVVRVINTSPKPVHVKASFFVDRFMDSATESPLTYLLPGEEREIQLNAIFNESVLRVSSTVIQDGNVFVTATPAENYDDRVQTKVLIHGRNAWDGDVMSLRYFVTPDHPEVLRYSRDVLLQHTHKLGSNGVQDFYRAKILFETFSGKLVYVGDPKQSTDFVQYPSETLASRAGDCDDMTVCFASLLSSIGISTALVDVIPPESPGKSHIYLLFDTGVEPRRGDVISMNPKRYVIRKNTQGMETIWIPIETTAIMKGFDEAWTKGAQEYFDDVEVGLGLAKGWVRIVDVN